MDLRDGAIVREREMQIWKSRVRSYLTCDLGPESIGEDVSVENKWHIHYVRKFAWEKRHIIFGNPILFAALVKLSTDRCESLCRGSIALDLNDELDKGVNRKSNAFLRRFLMFFVRFVAVEMPMLFWNRSIRNEISSPIQLLTFYQQLLNQCRHEFEHESAFPIEYNEYDFWERVGFQFKSWQRVMLPRFKIMIKKGARSREGNKSPLSRLPSHIIDIVVDTYVGLVQRDMCLYMKNASDSDNAAFYEENPIQDAETKDFLFDSGVVPICL